MGSFGFAAVVIYVLALSSTLQSQIMANPEVNALMELKRSLDPMNKYLSSWTLDGDPCNYGSFEGVACNEHRKVANISLQGKGLSGKLSPAVAELKCLSGLYLHYNSLSGEIPKEIATLTELSDLYLNVNNFSGGIPLELGSMGSLQVLELCCNQLTGTIPKQMGALKRLGVLALQTNKLTGQIPSSLGNLVELTRLDLSNNGFTGTIPASIANLPQLELLDVQNNSLSGIVPSAMKKLGERFRFENNTGLCGVGFSKLRTCGAFDDMSIVQDEPLGPLTNSSAPLTNSTATQVTPQSAIVPTHCNQTNCSHSSKFPRIAIVSVVIGVGVALMCVGFVLVLRCRRKKQKISNTAESSEGRLSTDQAKEFSRSGASPLMSIAYSNGWDSVCDGQNGYGLFEDQLSNFRFNLEEIESATQCFSEANLLGKNNFSCVYKGVLRDGSVVAIRSINLASCKSEEADFVNGLNLLTSLRHDNLVRLHGFCCSRGRSECFLVYDFATMGKLSRYLDAGDGRSQILDWSTRVSIVGGIAKGVAYLHSSEPNRPAIIHRSLSIEKVILDEQFHPMIASSGLSRILADDIVFSTLKVSAAMGYLAPEYVTTGLFTNKSDMYAFGVIILQILSGRQMLSNSIRVAAASCEFDNFIDASLNGDFVEPEAEVLAKLALDCTNEHPDDRPTMEVVIQELDRTFSSF